MYRDINITININININIVNVVLALYKTEEEVQECIVIKLYLMNKRMQKKESKGNDQMKDTSSGNGIKKGRKVCTTSAVLI